MNLNIPQDCDLCIQFDEAESKVKLTLGFVSTNWMDYDDDFINRIQHINLNRSIIDRHLQKEIEIKNMLDDGYSLLNSGKFKKAIDCFDNVLYYDSKYCEAIVYKSRALFFQKHYVKSLRYYKKAFKCDENLKDCEYYALLLDKSEDEIANFPKTKLNIYSGDEYFTKGDYENALKMYNLALADQSKLNTRIHSKLLNKKATSLFELGEFNESYEVFSNSLNVLTNDYAYFGRGYSLYQLSLKDPNNRSCESCIDELYVNSIRQSFKKAIRINKKQLLIKSDILNELNCFDDALKYYGEFLNSHFICDDDYIHARTAYESLNKKQ